MDKYVKRWVEFCFACGHGFKVDAEKLLKTVTTKNKLSFIGKILRRKPEEVTKDELPKPSACPVCGKADNVTVITLQEDKIAVPDSRS